MTSTTTAAIVLPSLDVAANVPAIVAAKPAKPARSKRVAKPATDATPASTPVSLAKPAKPAKPDADTVAATAAADAKRCDDLRDLARLYYAGASNVAHQRKPAKRDDYASRVTKPVQRIAGGNPSARDESGVMLIASVANRSGVFDPCAINLDLGVASRLASIGFLAFADDTFALTADGRERARLIAKRAA